MANRTRQDEAHGELRPVEHPTAASIERETKLASLMLSRGRILHDLRTASNPRYLRRLKQAIAYLDAQIALLKSQSVHPPAASTERGEAIVEHARATFGSWAKASDWLHSPCGALGDQTPSDLIAAERTDDVEDELGRIDHGIYV